MVAAQAHQKGSRTSASNPTSVKTIQNIFFCMGVYEYVQFALQRALQFK